MFSSNMVKHRYITGALFFVSGLLFLTRAVQARGYGDDNQGCAVDRPCFNSVYQQGNRVVFQFTGVTGWDFYNVRYLHGGGEKQVENRSGSFTFTNVRSNRVYKLRVQGCNSHFMSRSTCSAWSEAAITTK